MTTEVPLMPFASFWDLFETFFAATTGTSRSACFVTIGGRPLDSPRTAYALLLAADSEVLKSYRCPKIGAALLLRRAAGASGINSDFDRGLLSLIFSSHGRTEGEVTKLAPKLL